MSRIPLTKLQKEILNEFYSKKPTKVLFDKKQRKKIWDKAVKRKSSIDFDLLDKVCPAFAHQIRKSYETGNNIQSAVFSECVYAQTFANMMELNLFVNCSENPNFIPEPIKNLLSSYNLFPRYAYSNSTKNRMLIQAGGCNGIDSALITVVDLNIYTIEFKEPYAKTTEPDLPKICEDGKLFINDDFKERYPQFVEMLNEHIGLNIFEHMGENIHNFSDESINIAVSNNYTKKYADVICTEDVDGYLVMMPVNQVGIWAKLEGEIRGTGRNHYPVWTPNALNKFLNDKGAIISGNSVRMLKKDMEPRRQRGGDGKISGYKINTLFFAKKEDCKNVGDYFEFPLNKIRQIDPTIAAKMKFDNLKHNDVMNYYKEDLL